MDLKDKIRILRTEKSLTQDQLARAIEVDQSTVSYWESGRQEPNLAQRRRLCKFLSITQSQLFEGVW